MITKDDLEQLRQEAISRWQISLGLVMELWKRNSPAKSIDTARGSYPHIERIPKIIVLGNGPEVASLCSTLRTHGVESHPAGSLEEAVALTKMEDVRLAVVDEIFFASTSVGWQLRQVRVIPVVLMGSDREKQGWEKATELEADAYISKAMPQTEQVARIKAVMRRA